MPKKEVHFKQEKYKYKECERLTAKELQDTEKERHKKNKEIYRSILEDCEKKIRYHNSIGNKQTVVKIPYMKFDTPLYNITHAMLYVIRKLKKSGFTIANVHENGIHVKWNSV
jgi:hypothetical protein